MLYLAQVHIFVIYRVKEINEFMFFKNRIQNAGQWLFFRLEKYSMY